MWLSFSARKESIVFYPLHMRWYAFLDDCKKIIFNFERDRSNGTTCLTVNPYKKDNNIEEVTAKNEVCLSHICSSY